MKFEHKKIVSLLSVLAFTGTTFCVVGQAAGEVYDEDAYGPEAAIEFSKPVKGANFSHKVHTMDAGLECDSCHDEIFSMEAGAAEAKGDYNMKSLYEGKYCGACHDGSTAFASNTNCTSCHIDATAIEPHGDTVFTEPVKSVIFSHKSHTEDSGLSCDSCHDGLFEMKIGSSAAKGDYTMQSLYDGKYCGACHDGQTAFASNSRCTVCHIGVKGYDRLYGGPKTDGHGGGH